MARPSSLAEMRPLLLGISRSIAQRGHIRAACCRPGGSCPPVGPFEEVRVTKVSRNKPVLPGAGLWG